ncbi:hypothetical protein [Oryzifoliimicrobium ureilyticus]|uniref:hypothetical protein n=1 Tax=Oryzifoliimicrobium ureilyticus TaxID=3113724 RepID=UPI0030764C0F
MLRFDQDQMRYMRRVLVHFPGFEPLTAAQHRQRFSRAAVKTAGLWDTQISVGDANVGAPSFSFDVAASGGDWSSETTVHVLDHNDIVERLNGQAFHKRLWNGFQAAGSVVLEGGAFAYFRHAWRFGLFFIFPFLMMLLAFAATLALLVLPWMVSPTIWLAAISPVLAYLLFFHLILPWFGKNHVLHLFADWELAVAVARLDKEELDEWLSSSAAALTAALREPADEYVLTSHSMGSALATHVLGMVLERHPDILSGKRLVFVTLGGALLQASLMRSAARLRARAGLVLRYPAISWLEVQCLTDVISFYKAPVAALTGHPDAPQPRLIFLRLKAMLAADRYRRIKRDFLRVHRQYVLDADKRSHFDFVFMAVAPYSAEYLGLPEQEIAALEASEPKARRLA